MKNEKTGMIEWSKSILDQCKQQRQKEIGKRSKDYPVKKPPYHR